MVLGWDKNLKQYRLVSTYQDTHEKTNSRHNNEFKHIKLYWYKDLLDELRTIEHGWMLLLS